MDPGWKKRLDEMKRSGWRWPFVYPNLLRGSIAYSRYMIGNGVRKAELVVDEIPGESVKGTDHATAWRRTCTQTTSLKGTASPHIPSKAARPSKSR